jgi:hypothetical protein
MMNDGRQRVRWEPWRNGTTASARVMVISHEAIGLGN